MAKEKGVDALVYVQTATGTYTLIGGQQGAKLKRQSEVLEGFAKDDDGWKTKDQGAHEWSLELDAFLKDNDISYDFLEDAWENRTPVVVKLERPNGKKYEGTGVISELPAEHPEDDFATYSFTIEGTGALTKTSS